MDIQEKQFQEMYLTLGGKQVELEKENGEYTHSKSQMAWGIWQVAKANAMPEWISVSDKLPPANILVLGISQTPRNIFNIYSVMALDEFEEADATHWMPLPDAPLEPTND